MMEIVFKHHFLFFKGKINEKMKKLLPFCQRKKQDIPKLILYEQRDSNVSVMNNNQNESYIEAWKNSSY